VGVSVGDVIELTVTDVAAYACWGVFGRQVGFVHCYEWSWERPIPEADQPKVGDQLKVKVFRVVNEKQESLPLDVTFGGRIKVDFAASVTLLRPKPPATLAEQHAASNGGPAAVDIPGVVDGPPSVS
jgi:hypothetical protein